MRSSQKSASGLTMTWVAVRGVDGRVRMEARWASTPAVASKPRPHAA